MTTARCPDYVVIRVPILSQYQHSLGMFTPGKRACPENSKKKFWKTLCVTDYIFSQARLRVGDPVPGPPYPPPPCLSPSMPHPRCTSSHGQLKDIRHLALFSNSPSNTRPVLTQLWCSTMVACYILCCCDLDGKFLGLCVFF